MLLDVFTFIIIPLYDTKVKLNFTPINIPPLTHLLKEIVGAGNQISNITLKNAQKLKKSFGFI